MDDTHANLAFQALRQEPFVMEEFAFLANRIKELHEVGADFTVCRRGQLSSVSLYCDTSRKQTNPVASMRSGMSRQRAVELLPGAIE